MILHRHERKVVVAVVAAAMVAVAVGWWLASRGNGQSQGPLVTNLAAGNTFRIGLALRVGQSGSVSGPFLIRNTGDQPLSLDKIEPIGMQKGFDLRGAYVLNHPNHLGDQDGYRVPANGRVLPGAVVAPHQQVELVLGVTAAKPGRYSFKSFDIAYHGGGSFRRHAALGIAVCAPVQKYPNCETLTQRDERPRLRRYIDAAEAARVIVIGQHASLRGYPLRGTKMPIPIMQGRLTLRPLG